MALGMVIQPDGTTDVKIMEDEEVAAEVGGYLEAIHGPDWIAYCDEDGKLKGLERNEPATKTARYFGWKGADVLVGPVVFMGDDGSSVDIDLPQRIQDWLES